MSERNNTIRFYHYISAVLVNQQLDPLCCQCKPFTNTVARMRDAVAGQLYDRGKLPDEMAALLDAARNRIDSIHASEDAIGQKTAGNCKMPEGVCLVKASKAILTKI